VGETAATHKASNSTVAAPAQEPALMLSQIRFFNEFPIPSSARTLLASMAFYPGFDVSRFSTLRTKAAEIKPLTVLSSNGENLGTVLHEILTRYDYRDTADDLREFLRAAYSTFEEIHCDTTFGTPAQVLVRLREKGMGRSTELWELSDGMLRFLCLAVALLNPLPPPLVAIDEPEAGLHPKLLPVVADMIKAGAERTQVLVTTHSPDLLSRFDIEDVAVMTRGDEIRTRWHRPADRKTLVEMLKDVAGDTLGDLLRSGELEASE
jgi:predicted ATPase